MIQCKDCELCEVSSNGRKVFKCDPFSTIKEPECIAKWQLMHLDMLLATYHGMNKLQEKLAPLQDKIFKYMKKEIESMEESEQWKWDNEEENNEPPEETFPEDPKAPQ